MRDFLVRTFFHLGFFRGAILSLAKIEQHSKDVWKFGQRILLEEKRDQASIKGQELTRLEWLSEISWNQVDKESSNLLGFVA